MLETLKATRGNEEEGAVEEMLNILNEEYEQIRSFTTSNQFVMQALQERMVKIEENIKNLSCLGKRDEKRNKN